MKWNLSVIYKDEEEWKKELKECEKNIDILASFKNSFSLEDTSSLLEFLNLKISVSRKLEKLYSYAFLFKDINLDNPKGFELLELFSTVSTKLSDKISFFEPEIISFGEEKFLNCIKEKKEFERFIFMFEELFRAQKHFNDEATEALLSRSNALSNAYDIFESLNEIDLKFEDIVFEDGSTEKLTHSSYSTFLMHPNQKIRKQAFEKVYKAYESLNNTYAAIFISNLKETNFYREESKFNSPIEAALFSNNIPTFVYQNLLDSVENNLPSFHRYTELRKKSLGLNEINLYDFFAPITSSDEEIPFEECMELLDSSLSVLGKDYIEVLHKAIQENWVDVYPTDKKTSGAYSFGPNSLSNPYVLLNHTDDYDGLFTMAHEFGHMMHSYYSNNSCDELYSSYSIFIAEVASTVNEVLLMLYLIDNASENDKKHLICEFLDKFKSTFFRQTQFAEFEYLTHNMVAQEIPLSKEILNDIYYGLNKKYFGDGVVINEEIQFEWSRIPHFYSPFYVYQYATGFATAIDVANRIFKGEEGLVDKYRKFLSVGGSIHPIEALKIIDVDLTKPFVVNNAIEFFNSLNIEFEKLI